MYIYTIRTYYSFFFPFISYPIHYSIYILVYIHRVVFIYNLRFAAAFFQPRIVYIQKIHNVYMCKNTNIRPMLNTQKTHTKHFYIKNSFILSFLTIFSHRIRFGFYRSPKSNHYIMLIPMYMHVCTLCLCVTILIRMQLRNSYKKNCVSIIFFLDISQSIQRDQ